MPASKTPSNSSNPSTRTHPSNRRSPNRRSPRPRRILLSSDDTLARFICLPESDQMTILQEFAAAVDAAEHRVIVREAAIYDAQHRQASAIMPA